MKNCKHKFKNDICIKCNKTIKECVIEAWDKGEALALEAQEKNIPADKLIEWVFKKLK